MKLRIELPWPDPALSPNRKNGRHWSAVHGIKGKRIAGSRILALLAMQQAGYTPPPGVLAIKVTFCPPTKVRRDLDNLHASMKPDFDGISQALGVDDQHFHPITLCRGEVVKGGRVVLEVGC